MKKLISLIIFLMSLTAHYELCSKEKSLEGYTYIYDGITVSPSTIQQGENFVVTFRIREMNGESLTIKEMTCAISDHNRKHLFDMNVHTNIYIPPNGTYTYTENGYTHSGYLSNPGTYIAEARGRVGVNWYTWSTTGNGVNPRTFYITSSILDPPILTSPSNEGTLTGPPYQFTWQPVSGASAYQLKIADNPTFIDPLLNDQNISGSATSYNTNINLNYGQTYYWQMRTLNSSGTQWGTWGQYRSFTPTQVELPPPNLLSPSNGENLTGPPYKFTWQMVSGAGGYQLKLSTDPLFNTTIFNDNSIAATSNTYEYNETLTYGIKHYWQMRTLNSSGTAWGDWSPTGNFIPQSSTDNLELIYPAPNQTVVTDKFTFRWSDVGAKRYELYVDNNSGLGSPEISSQHFSKLNNCTESEFEICGNWLQQNFYFWKVIAEMPDGRKIESATGRFTYTPPTVSSPLWQPLYRLYNSSINDHFYCSSDSHRTIAQNSNYKDERVEGFISTKRFNSDAMVEIFRFCDSEHKCHYYTTDPAIKDSKIADDKLIYEGITGFAYKYPAKGLTKLYCLRRIFDSNNYDYFYTISQFERDHANSIQFELQTDFECYVSMDGDEGMIPFLESHLHVGNGMNPQNGNFQCYNKTSFNMPSIGLPLIFAHTYNSKNVHLADHISPMGPGWTHTYNIYLIKTGDFIAVYWSDGSIHLYNNNTLECLSIGVYDYLHKLSGGKYSIEKKNQMEYYFEQLPNSSPDSPYMLKYIEDRNGNKITCDYYETQYPKLKTVTGTTNRLLTLSYNSENKIISVNENGLHRQIRFSYDNYQNLSSFTDAENNRTEYTYDTNNPKDHQLTRIKLPKGNIIDNNYEDRKIKSQTFGRVSLSLDYQGSKTIVEDTKMGYKIECEQNSNNVLTRIIDASGTVGDREYYYTDSRHPTKPTRIKDNLGNYTYITYDGRGNITETRQPESATHKYRYNSFNDVTTYTDPENNTTNYAYNSKGNLIKITDPRSNSISINRQQNGLIQSIANQMNHTTIFDYDNHGNIRIVTPPTLPSSYYEHDNGSRLKKLVNALGQNNEYDYYPDDLIKLIRDDNQNTINYTYDANDNLISVSDQKHQQTSYSYNNNDLLDWSQNAISNRTAYNYNDDGSIRSKSYPNGKSISYTYDNIGRLETLSGSGYSARFTLDKNGNITAVSDNNTSLSFTYDALNRLTSYRDAFGNTVAYTYDRSSNIKSIRYPGSKTVRYNYYSDNRLQNVTDWNGKTTEYKYRADGQIDQITYPNNCYVKYEYDASDRLIGVKNRKSNGEVICSYSYTLDAIGNVKEEDRIEPVDIPPIEPANVSYSYNAANRMLSAGSASFNYDANGNLTSGFSLSLQWDYNNRLTKINGRYTAEYLYDVFGNRRQAIRNGKTTRYVLDINGPMSQVLMETDANNNPRAYYIYGIGLIYRIKADGTYQYYHYNNVGSTIAMTDQSQNITHKYFYTPFGELLAKAEKDFNPFRYVGQFGVMDEENGLYFMRARYYDPVAGRFISEDPIWDVNLYAYANNNPHMFIDPKGEFLKEIAKFVAKKVGKVIVKKSNNAIFDGEEAPGILKYLGKIPVIGIYVEGISGNVQCAGEEIDENGNIFVNGKYFGNINDY